MSVEQGIKNVMPMLFDGEFFRYIGQLLFSFRLQR
jgi:hypothetical protein